MRVKKGLQHQQYIKYNESHRSLCWVLHEKVRPTVHYCLNSNMVDISWLSSIKFRISVKCQSVVVFFNKQTIGGLSKDRLGKVF